MLIAGDCWLMGACGQRCGSQRVTGLVGNQAKRSKWNRRCSRTRQVREKRGAVLALGLGAGVSADVHI